MFIVVAGNPIDGVMLYGPFNDAEVANDWADKYLNNTGCDWWITPLKSTNVV
jgi:hypothetical protein